MKCLLTIQGRVRMHTHRGHQHSKGVGLAVQLHMQHLEILLLLLLHVWIPFNQFSSDFYWGRPTLHCSRCPRIRFPKDHSPARQPGSVHKADFDQLKHKLYRQKLKGSGAGLFTSLIDWIMCFICAILKNHHAMNHKFWTVLSDNHMGIFTLAHLYVV